MAVKVMNIGEASSATGVSAKMIRYYESVALIRPANRTAAGYRLYDKSDVQTLRFLKRARSLGFSVNQMRDLLALWRDEDRSKSEVQKLALSHAAALDAKAREIAEMSAALRHLARQCETTDRPGCPIIEDLADQSPARGRPRPAATKLRTCGARPPSCHSAARPCSPPRDRPPSAGRRRDCGSRRRCRQDWCGGSRRAAAPP